ncbi:MAG: hypothetical protein LC768_18525 [Acidobacteria bacterium]|nr:hypothetical protein [Acidobacteriota bacterium]MCA1640286.1 hypothetical protein [Acidobacteriota bacterium]
MNKRLNETSQIQRFNEKKNGRVSNKYNRPFWLPASNYYILSFAIAVAFFFLIWGALHEEEGEAPWIFAGFGSSLILVGAVFLREIVLKKARNQFLVAQRRLDNNVSNTAIPLGTNNKEEKLSLQKNAEIISNIKHKSEAARILRKLPEAHLEVFESCDEYLSINKKALETVSAGSPRLAALRRGREIIKELHKFHLLTWAGMQSRLLTQEAKNQFKFSDKLNNAHKAQSVLETALQFYPNDTQLIESEEVLKEFITSIKIFHWIEQAERAAFKKNYKRAISCYQDALFFLARENINKEEGELITEQINRKIENIHQIEKEVKEAKRISTNSDLESENKND